MKKQKQQQIRSEQSGKQTLQKAKAQSKNAYLPWLFAILILTALSYFPVLKNGLLEWDDANYVSNNPLVHTLNLSKIFSEFVMGNYHPFTILTLAIEYKFFGMSSVGYHFINLVLHLLNTLLVYFVVLKLSSKTEVALVCTLLFGIHPIHVESVAWVAEIKDLLYTFFFLGSYLFYLKYQKNFTSKFLIISILLFLFSLLSKAMAASLPVLLLLTDYFSGRKFTYKTLLEKLPFFVMALIFGVVAINAQKSIDATSGLEHFNLGQRMVFACYGFVSYLYKLILPFHLSAYYPYPQNSENDIPSFYYAFIPVLAGIAGLVFYSIKQTKKVLFGMGFFSITIFLVLQLLPVGSAIMADRYCYIPSIGIFYLAGEYFIWLWNAKGKVLPLTLIGLFSLFYSIKTFSKSKVWINDISLWTDMIEQDPEVGWAYYNRGTSYMKAGKSAMALADFNKAIEYKQKSYQVFNNRGNILMTTNRIDEALLDYDKAIELNPNDPGLYINRGNIYRDKKKYEAALSDYNKVFQIKSDFALAYLNRAILYMGINKNKEALVDLDMTIKLEPYNHIAYYSKGNIYFREGNYEEAIRLYTKTIEIKGDYTISYYGRALAEINLGLKEDACKDLNQAVAMGYQPANEIRLNYCK